MFLWSEKYYTFIIILDFTVALLLLVSLVVIWTYIFIYFNFKHMYIHTSICPKFSACPIKTHRLFCRLFRYMIGHIDCFFFNVILIYTILYYSIRVTFKTSRSVDFTSKSNKYLYTLTNTTNVNDISRM